MAEQLRVKQAERGPELVGNVIKAIADRCMALEYSATGSDDITRAIILYADQETSGGISKMCMMGSYEVAQTVQLCMMLAVGLQHLISIGDTEGLAIRDVLLEFDKAVATYESLLPPQAITLEDILGEKH